ncbi:MAG: choice-of-anchor D domain-containing protein [Candidatus Kapaibacterium sp.]
MKLFVSACLLFTLHAAALHAQFIKVLPADATAFPTVSASFYSFDQAGAVLRPAAADLTVSEFGKPCTILSVTCPPIPVRRAISSVLTMDISASMNDQINGTVKMDIARAAARAWIEDLPLGASECALTTFDDKNYLMQDYTTDKAALLGTVGNLIPNHGTDYDAGLLAPQAGALQVSKTGKHDKIIVFLSDGLPSRDPDEDSIVAEAQRQGCKIYCVMVAMFAPQSMREISSRTGGKCFESIRTIAEIQAVYRSILAESQGIEPCRLTWQSSSSCIPSAREVSVGLAQTSASGETNYTPPANSASSLKVSPSTLYYYGKTPGSTYDTTITLTAQNASYTVTSITSTNPAFSITPPSFTVSSGQSQVLTVHYTPTDSGYAWTKFEFVNAVCPVYYFVSAGYSGTSPSATALVLTAPNGTEEFAVGSDTVISWSGISPDDTVTLDYSTTNGATWEIIAPRVTGGSYRWHVPNTPSNQCLARVRQFNSQRENWALQFKGNNLDEGRTVALDPAGNIYVAGSYKGSITFGSFTLNASSTTATDGFVAKIRQDKTVEWVQPIVSPGNDVVTSLATDNAGNIFATGVFAQKAVIGGKTITEINSTALGELFLVKFHSDGSVEWAQNAGSKYDDIGGHLTTDGAGNVYMVGGFNWDAKFGTTVIPFTEKLRNNMYVAKYHTDGVMEWVKIVEKAGSNSEQGVCTDRNGNIFITGRYEAPIQFGKTALYDGNIFLVKFLASGTIDWATNIGGDIFGDGRGVAADDDGNIIVAGSFNEKMVFGTLQFYSSGSEDVFLAKYRPTGALDWVTHAGGTGRDKVNSIAIDGSGSIYIAGEFQAEAAFDDITIKNAGGTSGFYDIFHAKYFPNGKIEYAKQAGGLGADFCSSITSDRLGNIAMTGTFEYKAKFDTTILATDTIIGILNKDIYVRSMYQRELQSDVSDAAWSIIAPRPGARDVDMGSVPVLTSRDSLVESLVFNGGTQAFKVNDIQIRGGDSSQFMLVSGIPPFSVPAGKGVNVEFRFTPASQGLKQSQIVIITQGDTLRMKIWGNGTQPSIQTIGNGRIDFGKVFVGKFKDTLRALTIMNAGTKAVVIDSIGLGLPNPKDFSLLGGSGPISIPPDSSLRLDLRFTARSAGRTGCALLFYYKDVGSPSVVQLSGEGILNTTSDTVIVSVDTARGYPGELAWLHFRIRNAARLAAAENTMVQLTLRCNSSLLFPVDSTPAGVLTNAERTLSLSLPVLPSNDTVVAVYPMLAMLGTDTATRLILENASLLGGSAALKVEHGRFELLGVCYQGGARLIRPTPSATLSVRPNPITHRCDVEFESIENDTLTLSLVDASGRRVQQIFSGRMAPGRHSLSFEKEKLAAGTYFLILESPTIRKAMQVEVK